MSWMEASSVFHIKEIDISASCVPNIALDLDF